MAVKHHTRRAALGAIAATSAVALLPGKSIAIMPNDGGLIAAWEVRQRALATIEARGSFYTAEEHSPAETALFDEADMRIMRTQATTVRGALIHAWVAWSYVGVVHTATDRNRFALIRRADFASLEPMEKHLDMEHRMMLQTVRSLRLLAGEI